MSPKVARGRPRSKHGWLRVAFCIWGKLVALNGYLYATSSELKTPPPGLPTASTGLRMHSADSLAQLKIGLTGRERLYPTKHILATRDIMPWLASQKIATRNSRCAASREVSLILPIWISLNACLRVANGLCAGERSRRRPMWYDSFRATVISEWILSAKQRPQG